MIEQSTFTFSFTSFFIGCFVTLIVMEFYRRKQQKIDIEIEKARENEINVMLKVSQRIRWKRCEILLLEYAKFINKYIPNFTQECDDFIIKCGEKIHKRDFYLEDLETLISEFDEKHERWVKEIINNLSVPDKKLEKILGVLKGFHAMINVGFSNLITKI